MTNALIVDDEKHNVVMLQSLLKENCPDINVIDIAYNVDNAFEKINLLKPQLVFLDIKMPIPISMNFPDIVTNDVFEVSNRI